MTTTNTTTPEKSFYVAFRAEAVGDILAFREALSAIDYPAVAVVPETGREAARKPYAARNRTRVVAEGPNRVRLICDYDDADGSGRIERVFYRRDSGYVWEEMADGQDRQAFEGLGRFGSTLMCDEGQLLQCIRNARKARAYY